MLLTLLQLQLLFLRLRHLGRLGGNRPGDRIRVRTVPALATLPGRRRRPTAALGRIVVLGRRKHDRLQRGPL